MGNTERPLDNDDVVMSILKYHPPLLYCVV